MWYIWMTECVSCFPWIKTMSFFKRRKFWRIYDTCSVLEDSNLWMQIMSQRNLLTLPNYQSNRSQCLKLSQCDTFKMTEYLHWFPWIKKVSFWRRKFMILFLYFKVKCQDPNDASNILLTFPNYQFIRTKVRQWDTFKMTEYLHWFPWIKKVSFRRIFFRTFMILVLYFKVKC